MLGRRPRERRSAPKVGDEAALAAKRRSDRPGRVRRKAFARRSSVVLVNQCATPPALAATRDVKALQQRTGPLVPSMSP